MTAEWQQLHAEYTAYLQRFYALHSPPSPVVPLTPRQYCAATVLHEQARRGTDQATVAELDAVLILCEIHA